MKNKKLLFGIIGLVVVVAAVLCFVLWPRGNKKEAYIEAVKKSLGFNLDEVKEQFNLDNLKDKVRHITIEGTVSQDEKTAPINADIYLSVDKLFLNAKAEYEGNKEDLDLLYKDSKIYFTMKDVLENLYYYPVGNGESGEQTQALDYSKLLDIIDTNFEKIIKSKNIEVTDSNKIINDIEYSTKKYSYTFTGEDFYNLANNVIEDIKKEKDLYNILSSLMTQYQGKLGEYGESLSDLGVFKEIEEALSYTVYLKGDDVVSAEIVLFIPVAMGGKSASVPVTIVINNIDGYFQLYVSAVGYRLIEVEVNKKAGTLFLAINGEKIITGTISDNKITIESGDVAQIPEFNVSIEFDKVNNTSKLDFEIGTSKASLNIKGEDVDAFPNYDVSGAVPYEEATGNDKLILDSYFNKKDEYLNTEDLIEIPSI